MRLKTAPRVIIGLIILVAAGWGLNTWLEKRPVQAPAVPTAVVEVAPPVPEQAPVAVQPQPQAQPVQPQAQAPAPVAPQPRKPATRDDAGMDALLGGK